MQLFCKPFCNFEGKVHVLYVNQQVRQASKPSLRWTFLHITITWWACCYVPYGQGIKFVSIQLRRNKIMINIIPHILKLNDYLQYLGYWYELGNSWARKLRSWGEVYTLLHVYKYVREITMRAATSRINLYHINFIRGLRPKAVQSHWNRSV